MNRKLRTIAMALCLCFQSNVLAEEVFSVPEGTNRIWISINGDFEQILKDSHNQKFDTFKDTEIKVNDSAGYKGEQVKGLTTRGQTCLKAPRRCLGIKLSEKITFRLSNAQSVATKNFSLSSMWQDLGYANSNLGYSILAQAGLFPIRHLYAEVLIKDSSSNGKYLSKGLYLITENPDKALGDDKGVAAPYVLRRGYRSEQFGDIKLPGGLPDVSGAKVEVYKKELENEKINNPFSETAYSKAYQEIYTAGVYKKSGVALYEELSQRMDIDAYLKWLAINSFLKNGDYTDEVYFYADAQKAVKEGKIYFRIMGWDYDGLFAEPHLKLLVKSKAGLEILKDILGIGGGGESDRLKSHGIPIKVLDQTLLYSAEDNLDLKIGVDAYLYKKYLETLRTVVSVDLSDAKVRALAEKIYQELFPYLNSPAILAQSQRDDLPNGYKNGYTKENIRRRLDEIVQLLATRRSEILRQSQTGGERSRPVRVN